MFERFTDRARRVLVLAQEEARLMSHGFIGTEHILLGLIEEGRGVAAKALESLGISPEAVREKVEETVGTSGTQPSASPPFTPRAKKVLELSLREALQLGHSYIGTEHMLLGLLREGEGEHSLRVPPGEGEGDAVTVLVGLGADPDRVRHEVLGLMSGGRGPRRGVEFPTAAQSRASAHEWAPPTWDRPSEGTVPAVLAVDALVLRNDVVAVAVDRLEVYPNGFTINLVLRENPHRVRDLIEPLGPVGPSRWPHVGVRFADGRTAGCGPARGSRPAPAKDELGVPTEVYMSIGGRGGAPDGWRAWAWVFPLPPDGPLEVFVALEAAGLGESSVTIDGAAVRAAAERATVIWT